MKFTAVLICEYKHLLTGDQFLLSYILNLQIEILIIWMLICDIDHIADIQYLLLQENYI